MIEKIIGLETKVRVNSLTNKINESSLCFMTEVKKKKKVTRRRKTPTPEEVWEGLKNESDLDKMKDYSVKGNFPANSPINHPKFGLGVVTEVYPNKIDVVFKDGLKSLVQNRV